ncbi:hypothetical protein TL16_g01259 [Triparma laevis f. inornata]|uniref:RGS domain-containing protein n=1 Tax=Triparma laevis f. inornata TaxID=1714386 RepID=A0A9W6ZH97_9STRA|nr:hypothetical protein TL16_g01259 [Triparma laevis f. inornata]
MSTLQNTKIAPSPHPGSPGTPGAMHVRSNYNAKRKSRAFEDANQALNHERDASLYYKPERNSLSLTFKKEKDETEYAKTHSRRMRRGFVSSTLTRATMFLGVGVLYAILFDSDDVDASTSMVLTFGAAVFDMILVLLFMSPLSKSLDVQWLSAASCIVEGSVAVLGGALVSYEDNADMADYNSYIARQFFLVGGQMSCLKLSFALPKISLMRFPYLAFTLTVHLAVELAMLFLFYNNLPDGGPGIGLFVFFLFNYDVVAIINSRFSDSADRNLYLLLVNEKRHNKEMSEQIERTNKMARTVLAIGGIGDGDNEMDGSLSDKSSSTPTGDGANGDDNMVLEFDFFSRLAQKVEEREKTQDKVPIADALSLEVLEMRDLRSCMKDSDFKRGFRYFCNEETNLENLLFFEQVEDFRKKAEKLARKVNYTFIREGAPAQINIPSKMREELFNKLESHSDKSPIDTALFHTAQMEIYKIMNTDIFPRFKNSKLGRGLMFSRVNPDFTDFVKGGLRHSILKKTADRKRTQVEKSVKESINVLDADDLGLADTDDYQQDSLNDEPPKRKTSFMSKMGSGRKK